MAAEERAINKNPGTFGCAMNGICSSHSQILERIAILEKGMSTAESGITQAVKRIEEMRDFTIQEFQIIRQNLTEGILKRHSSGVLAIISVLTGLCCALAAVLFTHLLE